MGEVNWEKINKMLWIWQGIWAVAAIVMVGGVITVMGKDLPAQLPLFYSLPWGEDQLTSVWGMVWALGAVLAAWILGWVTTRFGRERVLSSFVAGAGLLSEIIIVLGLVRILLIIT